MANERLAQVRMDEKMITIFDSLKDKLNLKNDSEVLRQAITIAEKQVR
jgi:hypothetical protein